jgi:hypothetical protein
MVRRSMRRRLLRAASALFVAASFLVPAFAGGETGSGGTGGGGGSTTSGPTAPAAQLTSFKVTTGKYQSFAAIWAGWTVKNTGTSGFVVVSVEETDPNTGALAWSNRWTGWLATNDSASAVFDNDFAPWNTTYLVRITVSDYATGAVLTTQSTYATTGTPKI